MMAITGDSYCTSAWNGFLLNLKHCCHFYQAQSIAELLIFIGIFSIVGVNCLTSYLIMRFVFHDIEEVSNVGIPLAFVFFSTLAMASLFLSQYSQGVKAILMCFAVDIELNNYPKHGTP